MKIAHFGTFDVENYGDLLFPLVLERRLSDVCEEFVHVSPAGGSPVWEDCVPTVGFDEFLKESPDINGVVIGGGQVIRDTPTPLEVYDRGGVSPFTTYPSLWLGAAYVAARHNVPLCWNAPGTSRSFRPVSVQLLEWAASVTDYLAVRDEASRRSLEEAGVLQNIALAPDTALDISELWSPEEIRDAYEQAFLRRDRSLPERTLAFHVNSRWAGEKVASIAARIDRICESLDATAILLAIGPCHGDGEVQRRVSREMRTVPLAIDQPKSLMEVTACIARSEAYFGSSLHGMIAACAFGRRGALVASGEDRKYSGFLDHLGLSYWLVGSWAEAERRVGELLATPGTRWERAAEPVRPVLDGHWDLLRETLTSGGKPDGSSPPADKRLAVDRLHRIGEERYGSPDIFHALVAESLEESQAKLHELREKLRTEREKLRTERRELKKTRQERDHDRLVAWLRQVDVGVSELLKSRRWWIGNTFGRAMDVVLRRPQYRTAEDHLLGIIRQFRAWSKKQG